jgi:hypothetical protein
VLDPAYVHISRASNSVQQRVASELKSLGISSLGRYGRWTYCSIEDNMVEAEAWVHAQGLGTRSFGT